MANRTDTSYDTQQILSQMQEQYWKGLEESRETDTRAVETLLTVMLGGECYGLNATEAKEIFKMPAVVRVPRTPSFVLGIINLRGAITSIVDIRSLLGVPSGTAFGEHARVVLVEAEGLATGLVVEEVKEITTLPSESIQPMAKAVGKKEFFRGQAEYDNGLVILLDIPKLLTASEFQVGT